MEPALIICPAAGDDLVIVIRDSKGRWWNGEGMGGPDEAVQIKPVPLPGPLSFSFVYAEVPLPPGQYAAFPCWTGAVLRPAFESPAFLEVPEPAAAGAALTGQFQATINLAPVRPDPSGIGT